MTTFAELGLSQPLLRSLIEMGYEEPTPVQVQTIPCLMDGRDVVVQALTGTGKTAAFGIPLVEQIQPRRNMPQAVVLVPTRELAVQVAEELSRLGRHRALRLVPIYGGQPIDRQLRALHHGVHAIIATPGRLMDHMRRGSVDLSAVGMLILDEADRMLDMGFQEDVEYVISHLTSERVTGLFSATMPKPILDIVGRYMREAEMLLLSNSRDLTVPEIDQVFYQVPFPRKLDALCRVLDTRQFDRTIVFCATKRMVDEVIERLQGRGYLAEGLHGDISQANREKVLRTFREGRSEVLVATDVAARGLDVPDVGLVVNFDIPPDPEYYVHRIGRTGRMGQHGEAITFVNPREMGELRMIERATGAHIRRGDVPTAAEVEERDLQALEERLLDALSGDAWRRYRAVVEDLMADHEPIDLAAAALALAASVRSTRASVRRTSAGAGPDMSDIDWDRPGRTGFQPVPPAEHRRTPRGSGPPQGPPRFRAAGTKPTPRKGAPKSPPRGTEPRRPAQRG